MISLFIYFLRENTKKSYKKGHIIFIGYLGKKKKKKHWMNAFKDYYDHFWLFSWREPVILMLTIYLHLHRFEDHSALDGGLDGMSVIRQILTLAPRLLTDEG